MKDRGAKAPGSDFSDYNLLDKFQKGSLPTGFPLHSMGIPGVVSAKSGTKVCSITIANPHDIEARFFGYTDVTVDLDDGTLGVIDLKSSKPKDGAKQDYAMQLNGYGWSIENPEKGDGLEVSRIWLAYFTLSYGVILPEDLKWMGTFDVQVEELERKNDGVLAKAGEYLDVLGSMSPPSPHPICKQCTYMSQVAAIAYQAKHPTGADPK